MSKTDSYLSLLRENADFRRLWTAQLISLGGDWFASVALLGLTQELTGSRFYAGLILAANMLPHFLFSPLAGVVADRLDRRRLMIAADIARAFLALGLLLPRSAETAWIGVASLAAIAAFGAFFTPASTAAMPNLVPENQLARANVLMSSSWGVMLAIGAALGGVVASAFGRDTAFLVNSVSFLVSAAFILAIKARFSLEAGRSAQRIAPVRDVREGVAYARSDKRVTALLATKAGFGLGAGLIALLPIFATDVFRAGDIGIGLLFAARGLGALLGPFGARWFVRENERRLFIAIGGAMALYGVAYSLFPAMPTLLVALPIVTLAHLGGGAQWTMSVYGLQRITPDYIRGRIFAFDFGLVTLTMSLSLLAAGRLAESFDPRRVMAAMALIVFCYAFAWTFVTRGFWSSGSLTRLRRRKTTPVEGMPIGESD